MVLILILTLAAMSVEEGLPTYKEIPENSGAPPPNYPSDLAAEEARPVSSKHQLSFAFLALVNSVTCKLLYKEFLYISLT